jgi:hypothetical protein
VGGGCERVGVSQCADGFVKDSLGGCTPLAAEGECPEGERPTLGSTECRRFPCCPGNATSSIIVDGSADETVADGTLDHPHARLSDALLAHPESPRFYFAGMTRENVVLDRPVRLAGQCPQTSGIIAADAARPAMTILAGASGSVFEGLEVSGGSIGLLVSGAADIVLQSVHIGDVAGAGVLLEPTAEGASARQRNRL